LPSGAGFVQRSPGSVGVRKLLAAAVSLTGLLTLADPQTTAAPTSSPGPLGQINQYHHWHCRSP